MTRRQFVLGSTAAIASAAGLGAYAWYVEPHWLEVVRRPLPVSGLPDGLVGRVLVHITDVHVGPSVSDGYVLDAFRVLARLDPAIVVVTGDFTSWDPHVIDQASRVYAEMPHGRLATLGVLGNHDYGIGWANGAHADALAEALSALGIQVLRNEIAEVGGVQVVGMDDLWAGRFDPREALRGIEQERAMIALSHNPDTVDLPGWDGFEGWILAGHTHGGQCRLPLLPPPQLPVENRRYTSGEFELSEGRRMYIGRGVGHLHIRARFAARPEMTAFKLTRA